MADYLSVATLTKYLKAKFTRDPYLERVYLTGQVSNFRKRPKHQYFALKDEKAVIQATIWGGIYDKLGFELEEGMKINVIGRVDLYEPSGSYSLIIEKAEPDGIGALAVQFEQLKKELTEKGFFNPQFKQEIPQFVKKIGVVTSPSGAVIEDIITTVSRRFPGVEIILYPTKVQGDGSSQEVADNIARANQRTDLDVLIVGRGGGSIEDLWAFNEERVVRAIFESKIPVISSVGHETDTTLADFVADKRAATPTAAAEMATPITKLDLLGHLKAQENRMATATSHRIRYQRERVNKLSDSVIFRQPERLYDGYVQKLDHLKVRLQKEIRQVYSHQRQQVRLLSQSLQAQSPVKTVTRYQEQRLQLDRLLRSNMAVIYDSKVAEVKRLSDALIMLDTSRIVARGFAMVQKNQVIIDSVDDIKEKEKLTLLMRDGQLDVEVKNVQRKEI